MGHRSCDCTNYILRLGESDFGGEFRSRLDRAVVFNFQCDTCQMLAAGSGMMRRSTRTHHIRLLDIALARAGGLISFRFVNTVILLCVQLRDSSRAPVVAGRLDRVLGGSDDSHVGGRVACS